MKHLISALSFEWIKIRSIPSILFILFLLLVIQPLFAYISASQILAIGLDATPETVPELAGALPPLAYMGKNILPFGLPFLIIFVSLLAANEYKNHELRTTLLHINHRISSYLSKVGVVFLFATILSMVSIYGTLAVTHIALKEQGLHPLMLSADTWSYIGSVTVHWAILALLGFMLGMLFRSFLVPFLFLVPQVIGLGDYLADKWSFAKYLPVAASNFLVAIPENNFTQPLLKNVIILSVWLGVCFVIGMMRFFKSDVGGK